MYQVYGDIIGCQVRKDVIDSKVKFYANSLSDRDNKVVFYTSYPMSEKEVEERIRRAIIEMFTNNDPDPDVLWED